ALARPGDHASLDQLRDLVGDHPGVHAQVTVAAQVAQHDGEQAADADLEGGAVGHQARDVLCYRYIDIAGWFARILGGRPRGAHEHVDLAAAQPAVATDVRHLVVDLGDHHAGPANERGQVVRGQA